MKTVCPWCDKITLDGQGEPRIYRICPECEKIFMEELRPYFRDRWRDWGRRYPEEFHNPAQDHLLFVLLYAMIVALIVIISVSLNYITGGWFPSLGW